MGAIFIGVTETGQIRLCSEHAPPDPTGSFEDQKVRYVYKLSGCDKDGTVGYVPELSVAVLGSSVLMETRGGPNYRITVLGTGIAVFDASSGDKVADITPEGVLLHHGSRSWDAFEHISFVMDVSRHVEEWFGEWEDADVIKRVLTDPSFAAQYIRSVFQNTQILRAQLDEASRLHRREQTKVAQLEQEVAVFRAEKDRLIRNAVNLLPDEVIPEDTHHLTNFVLLRIQSSRKWWHKVKEWLS